MKKFLLVITLTVLVAPAFAMQYYLTSQWIQGASHFCAYGNGTVLNVGVGLCPLSING